MSTAVEEAPRDDDHDHPTGIGSRYAGSGGPDTTARTSPQRDGGAEDRDGADDGEEETQEDRDARRLRLANTNHGHVLDHIRRLHQKTRNGETIAREDLAELLELAEHADRNPVAQPPSGSVVHGNSGPAAPMDIHHTPFPAAERRRVPGQ